MTLGRDLERLLERRVTNIVDQVHDVALETELHGINAMRHRIEAAETDWGKARQAGWAGPARASAGRIETGKMYDRVTGETSRTDNERIVIRWGWQDPEDYFRWQEGGTKRIEGMGALHYSLHIAEDDLLGGLEKIR